MAAAVASDPSSRCPGPRTAAGAHTRAAWRLPARIRTTAVRTLLSESVDARCDRDLRFGAVGESALPLGRLMGRNTNAAKRSCQLHVGRARHLEGPQRQAEGDH